MVYLFSALMHPCSAWISRVEKNIDPSSGSHSFKNIQDETKKMQTYVRKYMDSIEDEKEREKFISDYMFDHGPFYIDGKLVFEPCPSKETVVETLLNIIKDDIGPSPVHPDVKYIISQSEVHLASNSGSSIIDIQSNVSWVINGSSSDCSVNPSSGYLDGNVMITVTENPAQVERTFTLTVRDRNTEGETAQPFTIKVIQAETVIIEPELRVVLPSKEGEEPPTEIIMESEGGTYKFTVFSNIEWKIYFPDEPDGEKPKWIERFSPVQGINDSYVNIVLTKNIDTIDYTTKIIVEDQLLPPRVESITVPITQKAVSEPSQKLVVEPGEITVAGINGSGYIDINTEEEWKISDYNRWLNIDRADRSGTGSKTIWYTADKNTNDDWREGSINVRLKNYSEERTQIIHQKPAGEVRTLSVSPEEVSIGAAGGIVTVKIISNTSWRFDSWFYWLYVNSINPMNGEGDAEVTIDVKENKTEEENNFSLTINGTSAQTVQLKFKQEPAVIYPVTIRPNTLTNVPASGDTYYINVSTIATDIKWSVSGIAGICTVDPQSGTGDGSVKVTVLENPNTNRRDANVIFKAEDYGADKDRTLKIIQLGQGQVPYSLGVSPDTLSMGNTQSTKTFNIVSNLDWKITSDQTWCTVDTLSGNGNKQITVSVTANTGGQRNAVITVSSSEELVEPVVVTVKQAAAT